MKIIILIALLLTISFSIGYSESEIPDSIKEKSRQIYEQGQISEKSVKSILSELSNKNIIQTIHIVQNIYSIPEFGQVGFVELSGRISEYGRTANVNLEITKPDGSIENIRSPLLETGRWSTSYPIDWTTPKGTYKVEALFGEKIQSVTYFHLTKQKLSQSEFPTWFMSTFEWWAAGQIPDVEFIYSAQYLANLGLITISEPQPSKLKVLITGEELVRRGTTHNINVLVSDGFQPIEGAFVTLTIEDYGEDIIREFEGFTDKNGIWIFSWEIPKSFDDIETLLAFISVSGNGSSQTQVFKFRVYCLPGETNCKVEGN